MSELKKIATRDGFGDEIVELGKENPNIAVCRYGREHGIPTPCNDLLVQLVLAKQSIYLGK